MKQKIGWRSIKEKTAWDWLELLIVPTILTVGGFFLNLQANLRQEKLANEQKQQEIFKDYLNQMSSLLLKGLQKNEKSEESWILAQARTITTLRELDVKQRDLVLNFLRSANLASINNNGGIMREAFLNGIDLNHTSLNGFDLRSANLENADLSHANLTLFRENNRSSLWSADLDGALLKGTDLTGADLSFAKLRDAEFHNANLHDAVLINTVLTGATGLTDSQLAVAKLCNTTMPNGSESDRDCKELKKKYLWLESNQ